MPFFTPVGGGGIGKATVTATTGSPTIDTSSRAGKTIYKFTGSGSITIGTAGYVEALIVGGGGAGGNTTDTTSHGGGGGAGGYVYETSVFLDSGTWTVTVGAGGLADLANNSQARTGDASGIRKGTISYAALGGGNGAGAWGTNYGRAQNGGSGGGDCKGSTTRFGAGQLNQGNSGGAGSTTSNAAGGGGGASAAGGAGGASNTGGNGGAGSANSITGTSVTYAGGGGGVGTSTPGSGGAGGGGAGGSGAASPAAGTVNRGGGGGGGYNLNGSAAGGSGYVVVVIG